METESLWQTKVQSRIYSRTTSGFALVDKNRALHLTFANPGRPEQQKPSCVCCVESGA